MDDNFSTASDVSSSRSSNEYDFWSTGEMTATKARRLESNRNNQQVKREDSNIRIPLSDIWKFARSIICVILFLVGLYLTPNLLFLNTFLSNLFELTTKKEQEERKTIFTNSMYHWLICLAVISVILLVSLIRHDVQNNEKHTKSTEIQIVDALMDLLQSLLNEPILLSQVKERKGTICHMWLALKDLQHSCSLPYQTELKLMELAQNTVEQFADDINILQLAITVLHNGISLKREMFQNATDGFLKNLLNFCEVHESVYKWKCFEILLCYLHVCNDVMTDSSLWYQHVVVKLKDILQEADIDGEANHVTLSRFKLYYTWLNDSNIDVVRQYAAIAICHLLRAESNTYITKLVDVHKLLELMKESK